MRRYYPKYIAALLALSLVLLSACGGTPQGEQSSGPSTTVAMGRYVEQGSDLPAGVMTITGLQQGNDGSLRLYGYSDTDQTFSLYTSTDGKQWLPATDTALESSDFSEYNGAYLTPDGKLLLAGRAYTDEFFAAMAAAGGGYSEDVDWPSMQFLEFSPDGSKREIPIKLPDASAGYVSKLLVAHNGDIFTLAHTEVYQFDSATGALKTTYSLDGAVNSMALSQNRLAVMSSGIATIYDTDSGDRLGTVEQLGLHTSSGEVDISSTNDGLGGAVAVGDDGAFYFGNSTGIYRRTTEGEVVERILDGSLVSLGIPSLTIMDMLVLPDSILVAFLNNVTNLVSLKQYTFDPTVPTLPSKELTIYSLRESKTVRQASSQYQLANPDTHVVLEVAPSELSTADALRTLNTRLLAGNAPDILVLDGMPTEAYLQKKVLTPLDEAVTEGILPNIVTASRSSDGKLYSIPARIMIPAMTGVASSLQQVNDVTSLADMLTTLKQAKPNISMVLQNCGGGILLNTFYPVFSGELYTDGKPDQEKLRSFLAAIKSIADLQQEEAFVTDDTKEAVLDMIWTSVSLGTGGDLMGIGYINSTESMSASDSVANLVEGGGVVPLLPMGSHTYLPTTQMGITSGSPNKAAATAFIQLALSPEVQGNDFADGLPVNEQSLTQMLKPLAEGDRNRMTYGNSDAEGVTHIVHSIFPSAEALAKIRGWVDTLDTPAVTKVTVLELLRSETAGYFAGSRSLEDTVTTLMQKLTLLEAEG